MDGADPITCRPADLLKPELHILTDELIAKSKEEGILLAEAQVDDVLTYALFPQVGLKFLKNRGNPEAFEPVPGTEPAVAPVPAAAPASTGGVEAYSVQVNGQTYDVVVGPQGELTSVTPAASQAAPTAPAPSAGPSEAVAAPLAGNIFKVVAKQGHQVQEGDVLLILEAMKMETEIRATRAGTVQDVMVKEGDSVTVGSPLMSLA